MTESLTLYCTFASHPIPSPPLLYQSIYLFLIVVDLIDSASNAEKPNSDSDSALRFQFLRFQFQFQFLIFWTAIVILDAFVDIKERDSVCLYLLSNRREEERRAKERRNEEGNVEERREGRRKERRRGERI